MNHQRAQPSDKAVEVIVEATERFRSRARSTAALAGAAAAAVAAGMAFGMNNSVPAVAQVWGLAASAAFALSTVTFVVASMIRVDELSGLARVFRIVFSPWRMSAEPDETAGSAIERLSSQAKAVRKRVLVVSDIGMWFGGIAILLLTLTVWLISTHAAQPVSTRITIVDETVLAPDCDIPRTFPAVIAQGALQDSGPLQLELPRDACGGRPTVALLPRDAVIVTLVDDDA